MIVKRAFSNSLSNKRNTGFSLIEMVIGIVTLSIALLVMTGALFPQAERSTNPWFQVRSAELAQSMMNEILARSFDENSPRSGSPFRCNETGGNNCINTLPATCPADPNNFTWAEEGATNRELFDDVDDFHCYSATGDNITNIENANLTGVYQSFGVSVIVQYAGTDLGFTDNLRAKRVQVTVSPPKGPDIIYTSYKANY